MNMIKKLHIFIMLFGLVIGALIVLNIDRKPVYAQGLTGIEAEGNKTINPYDYSGYGCNSGYDLQENIGEHVVNMAPEKVDGFGCGSTCGASREDGYSSGYHSGCRNWQVMPIISPLYRYWIDESTLTSLSDSEKEQFIYYVNKAAAEWNSVRIANYNGAIVELIEEPSNGIDIVPVRYNPALSDALGRFNPVPLFYQIEIKKHNDYDTIMHEFGHMIGLQDLNLNNDPWTHIALMGYAGNDKLHYQDIQGLAVANGKHSAHDYCRYWTENGSYNYVCFYCDITDTEETALYGGEHLVEATTCVHDYQQLVSAGDRYWHKCTKCYKVIETPFFVTGINNDSGITLKIVGQVDNREAIEIPREIGGQTVTHIGDYAFSNCSLTSVIFQHGSSIIEIGASAFANQSQLTHIYIPSSVLRIGDSAFEGCIGFEWNYCGMGHKVLEIGNNTFADCTSLETVPLFSSLITIGNGVFANCTSLSGLKLPTSLTSIGDNAFENCTSLTEITLPNGVRSIGNSLFRGCSSLTSVSMSKNVESIGNNAFAYCTSLKSFTIPSTVTEIGYRAFEHCEGLQEITIPSSVESIRGYAFSNCKELKKVAFDENSVLTNIGNSAFENCQSLGVVDIPEGVSSIYAEAFLNCRSLTEVKVPKSTTVVDNFAFEGCDELHTVYYGGESANDWMDISIGTNNVRLKSAEKYYFRKSEPDAYGYFWHYEDENIAKWDICEFKFTKIGADGYEISKGVSISGELEIPSTYNGLPVIRIAQYGFANETGITSVTIPSTVESIGDKAFYGTGIVSVTIPSTVTSIGKNAFGGNYLEAINVETGNEYYYSYGGVLFNAEGVLMICPSEKSGVYEIPSGTMQLADYAFYGCWQLTGVSIPDRVKRIGDYTFCGCDNMKYINISEESEIEYIGKYAFANCVEVVEITIPSGVTYMGAAVFLDWGTEKTVEIKADVSLVYLWDVDWALQCYARINWKGYYAAATEGLDYIFNEEYECYTVAVGECFEYSEGTVVIPAIYNGYPVTGVAESGFCGCEWIEKVMIVGSNLSGIGAHAFEGCINLVAINVSEGVEYIGEMAFAWCRRLESIALPSTLTMTDWTMFTECESLKSIVIRDGLTYIESSAFEFANGYTIYTTSGFDNPEWHFLNFEPACVVFYSCEFSADGVYVLSVVVSVENYVNATPTEPYREGYVFVGWSTTKDGEAEYGMDDLVNGSVCYDTVLYAVWEYAG